MRHVQLSQQMVYPTGKGAMKVSALTLKINTKVETEKNVKFKMKVKSAMKLLSKRTAAALKLVHRLYKNKVLPGCHQTAAGWLVALRMT